MLASFWICLRESIELGFVVALCFAVLDPASARRRWIVGGVIGGGSLAAILAVGVIFLHASWVEKGEDLLGATLLMAAASALLVFRAWRLRHGDAFVLDLHGRGRATLQDNTQLGSLSVVVAAAVFREGSETVLFLYGVASSTTDTLACVLLGLVLGASVGLTATYVIYNRVSSLPIRPLMRAANLLLILFSAGMAARAVEIFEEQGALSSAVVWNTTELLSKNSLFGHMLQCLIGYSDTPTINQITAYLSVLIVQFGISLIPPRRHASLESYRASLGGRDGATR